MKMIMHLLVVAALSVAGFVDGATAEDVVRVRVDPEAPEWSIPNHFIGFGYETSAVARPGYFSARNTVLVQLYRTLGPQGLVRIGGNISDHTRFVPQGPAKVSPQTGTTVINRAVLVDLGEFLRATGWKAMWGLNLATGSRVEAVEEAVAVTAALGDRLQSFEIGNEVDLQPRFTGNFGAYHAAYIDYKAAIRAVLPNASFSGPDVASPTTTWAADFANAESADMKLLTQHYYRGGAQQPTATIATLLAGDPPWEARLQALRRICRDKGLAYRINEVNSFYGGGKKGVSDTFASALWSLDYMFLLASEGCSGVNLETDVNQYAWISHYTPIFRDESGRLSARPCYYGMLAFAQAGKGALLKLALAKPDINLTAYATKDSKGVLWITLVNKDLERDAQVELSLPEGYSGPEVFRLSAPSASSRDHVTLAGSEVSADGKWTPGPPEKIAVTTGVAGLRVPRASAALLRLDPR